MILLERFPPHHAKFLTASIFLYVHKDDNASLALYFTLTPNVPAAKHSGAALNSGNILSFSRGLLRPVALVARTGDTPYDLLSKCRTVQVPPSGWCDLVALKANYLFCLPGYKYL